MRRLLFVVVGLIVASNGCDGANTVAPTAPNSIDALITALREQGATVTRGDTLPQSANPFFSTNARLLVVNDGIVSVFEYASVAAADRDASKVSSDGSTVGSTKISWIGPPHFYRSGRLIVIYAGSSAVVIGSLEAVMGPPFAHG